MNFLPLNYLPIIIVVILFLLAFSLLSNSRGKKRPLHFESLGTLFTPAERSFYGVLRQSVGDRLEVMGKVRVADVIKPRRGLNNSTRQIVFNKIFSKHFDFVLCKPDDLSIYCVVELDDASHQKKNRVKRDEFLDSACASAGIKIHHFKAKSGYKTHEIADILIPPEQEKTPVAKSPEVQDTLQNDSPDAKPACPKCSSELVLRIAKKGAHKGAKFLACSSFPTCGFIGLKE